MTRRKLRRALLLSVLLIGCETSQPVDPIDSSPSTTVDGGPNDGACVRANAERVDGDFRGICPTEPFRIRAADDWQHFVDRCVSSGQSMLPVIDFQSYEVIGTARYIDCPFSPGASVLGVESCGRVLRTNLWSWTDHCFCDYYSLQTFVYVVPRDLFDVAEISVIEEATCDQVTCSCDGELVGGCDAMGACETDWDSYPEHDGLPPP